MTENQAELMFTATVQFRRPGVQQWEITAQATDTLGVLEEFVRRRESGTVTVEDVERHAVISERYFRPPNGFFFA